MLRAALPQFVAMHLARGYAGAIGWGWAQDRDTAVSYAHANCLRYSSVSNIVVLVSAKK